MSSLSTLLTGGVLSLLSGPVAAEGLVQLSFAGQIERFGGARVELSVEARSGEELRRVELVPHLARGTGAADVAALLADRLQGAGIVVRPRTIGRADGLRAHVFIEGTVAVRVRAGHGLSVSVTTCEEPPLSVALQSPRANVSTARVVISASTMHGHTEARELRTFEVELEPSLPGAQYSEVLFRTAIENRWIAERPEGRAWRPVRMADGSRITGVGVDVDTAGDWRLEVTLAKEEGEEGARQ